MIDQIVQNPAVFGSWSAITAFLIWLVNTLFRLWQRNDEKIVHHHEVQHKTRVHEDSILAEIVKAARDEAAQMRERLDEMADINARLAHFDESLRHIEMLIEADEYEFPAAERAARKFLRNMKADT